MCLAIPGKILSIENNDDPIMRSGKVSFGGIIKDVHLSCVSDALIGDYVIVHAGFAISILNEQEASRVFKIIEEAIDNEIY